MHYELAEKYNEGITSLRGAGVFVEEEVRSFFESKINDTLDVIQHKKDQLCRIAVKERFAFQPKLIVEGDKLLWDRGYGFVGRKDNVFKLKVRMSFQAIFRLVFTLLTKIMPNNLRRHYRRKVQ